MANISVEAQNARIKRSMRNDRIATGILTVIVGLVMLIVVSISAVAAISMFSSPLNDFRSGITLSIAGSISITFSAVIFEKFRLKPVLRSFLVCVA